MASESVCNCFRSLTYEAVCDWVGQRTGERAKGCCPNVGEMAALPDGYAARVMGTELYVTNVYVDETGKLASVCSCPVGVNCKHGAALALEVSRKLNAGLEIASVTDRFLILDREAVLKRIRGRISKGNKERVEERFDPFAPIPRNGPDFARVRDGAPISFPNNRFVTNMWPNIRCQTADEVRKALASFRIEGRVLEGIKLFGESTSSDEASILCDAGFEVEGDSESRRVRRAYAQMPLSARVSRQVETNRLVRVAFRCGGTFEIDAERAPDFYLAMNQIDEGTCPERPVNVDGKLLFASLVGRKVERVEVITSKHEVDPFYLEPYDEPRELADAIVLRLDTGDGLRFRTQWHDLLVDAVDLEGVVKKASWESVKSAFYNRADVNIDEVTGVESLSGALYFGAKGARFAEHDRISFCPLGKGNVRSRRGCACIRRNHAAFFALADYVLRPTLKPGDRELSWREWEVYLSRVRLLMNDPRFKVHGNRSTVLTHAFRDSHDVEMLDDIERWSRKILRQQDRIRIEGINDVW